MPLFFPSERMRIMNEEGYPVNIMGLFELKDDSYSSIDDAINQFLDKLPTVDRESYPSRYGVAKSMIGILAREIARLKSNGEGN